MKILAILLHLGNIEFTAKVGEGGDEVASVNPESSAGSVLCPFSAVHNFSSYRCICVCVCRMLLLKVSFFVTRIC